MSIKLFGTDGVRGIANVYPINAGFAFDLANILSDVVCTKNKKVAIGKDTRISGDMLEAALIAGFTTNGVSVVSLGVVPTPLVTLKTSQLDVDMALMITASHNPYHDNGIKLINNNGDKFSDEFYAELERLLEQKQCTNKKNNNNNQEQQSSNNNTNKSLPPLGRVEKIPSIIEDYIENMRTIAPNYKALQGLRVVIDCANGAFYYILPQTFKDLGAGVITINNEPNGYNINENCGTQHTEQLSKTVVDSHANFGIAVDGDGDRIILVDNKGKVIDGDQLICFLANYMRKNKKLNNSAVVATEWSNNGLQEYFTNNGYTYYQSKVGERYVIDLIKKYNASLGGEVVGHIVLSQYSKTGDALATAIVLSLAYLDDGRKMDEIFPVFEPYPCIEEKVRFSSKELMLQATEFDDVKEAILLANKTLTNKGRLIVRKSGTEPVLKLRIEGRDVSLIKSIIENLKNIIIKYQK